MISPSQLAGVVVPGASAWGTDGRLAYVRRPVYVDGKRMTGAPVHFTVRGEANPKVEERTELWVMPDPVGDPGQKTLLVSDELAPDQPAWSPTGDKLAFLGIKDGSRQLFEMTLDASSGAGQPIPVTAAADFPFGVRDFVWAPDGTGFLVRAERFVAKPGVQANRAESPPSRTLRSYEDYRDGAGFRDGRRLHLAAVASSSHQRAGNAQKRVDWLNKWDANWDVLAYALRPVRDDMGRSEIAFVVKAAVTGECENDEQEAAALCISSHAHQGEAFGDGLALSEAYDNVDIAARIVSPQYSPDGRSIAYLAPHVDERGLVGGSYDRVWTVNADGEPKPRCLTRHVDQWFGARPVGTLGYQAQRLQWNSDGIYCLASATHTSHLKRVNPDTGTTDTIWEESKAAILDFGLHESSVVGVVSSYNNPGELHVATFDGADRRVTSSRAVTDHNRRFASETPWVEPEIHMFEGTDGPLPALIYRARGHNSERGQRPTIFFLAGGPHIQYGWPFHFECQLLAALGYNVVVSHRAGNDGIGERCSLRSHGDWDGHPADDMVAVIDQAKDLEWVDSMRICLVGVSFGATLGAELLTRLPYVRAAVLSRGAYDHFLNAFFSDMQPEMRDELRELADPRQPRSRGSLGKEARGFPAVLILHGDRDGRVPWPGAQALRNWLTDQDKTATFKLLHEVSHATAFSSDGASRLVNMRHVDYYSEWLEAFVPPTPRPQGDPRGPMELMTAHFPELHPFIDPYEAVRVMAWHEERGQDGVAAFITYLQHLVDDYGPMSPLAVEADQVVSDGEVVGHALRRLRSISDSYAETAGTAEEPTVREGLVQTAVRKAARQVDPGTGRVWRGTTTFNRRPSSSNGRSFPR